MKLEQHVDLTQYNSFSVSAVAEHFCQIQSESDILEARDYARHHNLPITILGGGSNVVLRSELPGLCLLMDLKGVEVQGTTIHMNAGEIWHEIVHLSLDHDLCGIENLALIPGQVGAAPIQNIGAYGVELSEYVRLVRGIEMNSGEPFEFDQASCEFAYRDSIFKRDVKNQYLITSLMLDLSTEFIPRLDYQGIRDITGENTTARDVCYAVTRLRQSKLPDPDVVGNAGSFFKNPVLSKLDFLALKQRVKNLTGHRQSDGYKVSAGFLIEYCGLKGLTVGGARVSDLHALVIENSGSATGQDVLDLASAVQERVATEFDLDLEIEPRVIPAT